MNKKKKMRVKERGREYERKMSVRCEAITILIIAAFLSFKYKIKERACTVVALFSRRHFFFFFFLFFFSPLFFRCFKMITIYIV